MQTNADQVEKDILETQSRLKQDASNHQKNKAFEFQPENARNLKEAETLLKDLFLDVDRAKRLKHPQADEIEKDIQQLHDRVTQLCAEYRALYEQLNIPDSRASSNCPRQQPTPETLVRQTDPVCGGGMGTAPHQIRASGRQVSPQGPWESLADVPCSGVLGRRRGRGSSAWGPTLSLSCVRGQKTSIWRGQSLGSLYHHLQGCTKELGYLTDRQTRILKQDWSDQMMDVQSVRREYEEFKSNELLSQEEVVNHLQDDGDRMIELKHPAVKPIQAHQEALKNEWQNFLNLCICQESHLKSVESYKKVKSNEERAG
ncbi:EVPL protein, partial [Syrrhaptes paradoxus]|nr:EVPL protein [Syrrhaptes paradoxus]